MVLMSMGQYNPAYLLSILSKIIKIRDNQINAQHFVLRKCQSTVDNQYFIFTFDQRHILANLVQSSQGNNSNFLSLYFVCQGLLAPLSNISYLSFTPVPVLDAPVMFFSLPEKRCYWSQLIHPYKPLGPDPIRNHAASAASPSRAICAAQKKPLGSRLPILIRPLLPGHSLPTP